MTPYEEPKVKMTVPKGPVFGEDTSDYVWNGFRLVPKGKVHDVESEEEWDEEDW